LSIDIILLLLPLQMTTMTITENHSISPSVSQSINQSKEVYIL